MIKSSVEILREYAQIIAEGNLGSPYDVEEPNQEDFEPEEDGLDYNKEGGPMRDSINDNEIDLPDESMQDEPEDDGGFEPQGSDDPVTDLAHDLDIDGAKLDSWLKSHNYEITPIGGLSNNKGNV